MNNETEEQKEKDFLLGKAPEGEGVKATANYRDIVGPGVTIDEWAVRIANGSAKKQQC